MRWQALVAAMALAGLSGCATQEPSGVLSGFLTVQNETGRVLAVFAFPDGSLINVASHLPPGSFEENMIRPSGRLGFDSLPGYDPARGVYLTIYVVQRQGADLTSGMTVSDAQLKQSHGRVTIDLLPSPR